MAIPGMDKAELFRKQIKVFCKTAAAKRPGGAGWYRTRMQDILAA